MAAPGRLATAGSAQPAPFVVVVVRRRGPDVELRRVARPGPPRRRVDVFVADAVWSERRPFSKAVREVIHPRLQFGMRNNFGDKAELIGLFRVVNFGKQGHLERAVESHRTREEIRAALVA